VNYNYVAIFLIILLILSIPASLALSVRVMANKTIKDVTGGQE
jgi:hypothetical protein